MSQPNFPFSSNSARLGARRGRRRGVALIYTAFGMTALLGASALTVDMGILYVRKSQAQRTADAAALAGAYQLATVEGTKAVREQQADVWARYYAKLPKNGAYEQGVKGTKVNVIMTPENENGNVQNNWIEVQVSRPETLFFGFFKSSSQVVFAKATAMYETLADFDIKGTGTYGVAPGPVNLSVFGPEAQYNNGDYLSSRQLANKTDDNPYNKNFKGYDFRVTIPRNFTDSVIEIFDPDCYNKDNMPDTGTDSSGALIRVDELRTSAGGTGGTGDATTTRYTLYDDRGTPTDYSDDRLLFDKTYGGATTDAATDMKWNVAFEGNRQGLPNSQFRLNVKTTGGSSENGFDLRVGPKRAAGQAFDPNNGATVNAQGHLPINFNVGGKVKIALGKIPVEAAGGDLTIRKFDTDVGTRPGGIVYSCDSLPGKVFPLGSLSGNGTFATDVLKVPDNYATAGTWYAEYEAGQADTSVWDMSYSNAGPGKPGRIKLIR